MKNLFKIILLVIILSLKTEAQQMTWQRLYNGPSNFADLGYSVCELSDGNFIVAGATQIPFYAIYILKLNSYGDTLWTKTIGGFPQGQLAYAISSSKDGGFVLTGEADTAFVIKLNNHGEILWYKRYNKFRYVQCYDIMNSPDGGYIACGRILHGGGFIIKIDSLGNQEWAKVIPSKFTLFNSIEIAINRGFILCGYTYDFSTGDSAKAFIFRIDDNGNTIWQKRYSVQSITSAVRISKLNDSYICSGTTGKDVSVYSVYFLRLDTLGNLLFSKLYSEEAVETLRTQILINNNKYLFAISSDSENLTNAKLILTDSLGNILNQKTYSGIKYIYLESVINSVSGDFVFSGTWGKYGTGDRDDIYVLKTDSNLIAPPLLNISSNNVNSPDEFILYPSYPNPFNSNTVIKYELNKKVRIKLSIINIEGKVVKVLLNETKSDGYYTVIWDASIYNSGIYYCQMIVNETSIKTIKLILIK